jgi:uncharacterized membrane protein YphA (DoxX/SURF4 family)
VRFACLPPPLGPLPGLEFTVTPQRYSALAAFGIVLLRLAIGWHFVSEGYTKLSDKKPFSAGFFGAAKGPTQPLFRTFIWDYDGRVRLDQTKVLASLDAYHARAVSHFGLEGATKKQADAALELRKKGVKEFFAINGDEISVYLKGLERRTAIETDRGRTEVDSLLGQTQKVAVDLRKDVGPWLAQIDASFNALEREINKIGVRATKGETSTIRLVRPEEHLVRAETVDKFIPYFDLTIGVLLIVGLFVRPVTLVAGLFLASVVSSQLPGFPGVAPVYYQVVELCAVIALFGVNAGRFAGLDFFVAQLFKRKRASQD